MIIMPLIVVSMISAVTKFDEVTSLGKIGGSVAMVLVFTTMLSSLVAIGITDLFNLTAEGMISGEREAARLASIDGRQGRVENLTVASYVAIGIMFLVHGGLLSLSGFNPKRFFSGVFPVLTFAFTSRSSAAYIPLNVETQTRKLGVPNAVAPLLTL